MTPERIAELLADATARLAAEKISPSSRYWVGLLPNIVTLGGLVGRLFSAVMDRGSIPEDALRDRLAEIAAFSLSWIKIDHLGEGAKANTKRKTK